MFCTSCGAQMNDGAKFCDSCGSKLEASNASGNSGLVTSIPLSPLPAGLSECPIKILSVNSEGAGDEGDMGVNIKYKVTNDTDEDWEQLVVRAQLLGAAGQIVDETTTIEEQSIGAGESIELELSFWGISSKSLGEHSEKAHIVLSAIASRLAVQRLGQIDVPETPYELVALKPCKVGDALQLVSGSLWKTAPDEEEDVLVEVKALVQNLTEFHLPEVKLVANITDKNGRELMDASGCDEVRPGNVCVISGSGYDKDKNLKGSKAELSISVSSPVASGITQKQGIMFSERDDEESHAVTSRLPSSVDDDGDEDDESSYLDLLNASKEEVLAAVSEDGAALEDVSEELKNDKDVVLAAVSDEGSALEYASEELKGDKDVVLAAASNDGSSLKHASGKFGSDKDVVLAAVSNHGHSLRYASEELRGDKDVVLAAVSTHGGALEYASEELRSNKDVVLAAVSDYGGTLESAVIKKLRYNSGTMPVVKDKLFGTLGFAANELRNDKNVVLVAINKGWGYPIEHASEKLRNDKEVVLAAVSLWGGALQYASERLRNDKEVVLAAVGSDALGGTDVLQYASDTLRADQEVMAAADAQDQQNMNSNEGVNDINIKAERINFTSEEIISSSIAINQKNPNRFEQLVNSVGIEETYVLPYLHFKNDPRNENNEVGDFEAQLRVALDSNEKSIETLIKGSKDFYATPDLFNFWRYALLSKFLIDREIEKDEIEIPESWPYGWEELVKFGVDLSSCISVLNKLNISVESEEISTDDYQGGLQTVVACYLALALNLNLEDALTEVARLIRMVTICNAIDGVQISSETMYGMGEYAGPCRLMLEEFTGVCIDAPDGVDFKADGYLDDVDWDSVADRILQEIG